MPRARPQTPSPFTPEQEAGRTPHDTGATAKAARTVTVCCKIPHGLILQLCKETKWFEETPSGTRERVRFDKVGERKFIRGNSYPTNPQPGFPERGPMAGGYAMTAGVDKDFWDEWLRQNRLNPVVTGGMIFAEVSGSSARDKAKEQSDLRSGLEPLDIAVDDKGRSLDPRMPRPASSAVGPITTADLGA